MTRIKEERIDEMLPDLPRPAGFNYDHGADLGTAFFSETQMRAYARKALKELCAQGGVSVRPLQWQQTDPHFPWAAQSLIGRYTAWDFDGKDGHWMRPGDVAGVRVKGGLEEAKAAAEADYRTRVLSALETEAVEPSWFAVQSVTGSHIGMWRDRSVAVGIKREYPDGELLELYAHSPHSSMSTVTGELIAAAQNIYDKCASETGTVTILDQERLGDALRALSSEIKS